MSTIACKACGAEVAESDAYFSELGKVCESCHIGNEDADRAARAVSDHVDPNALLSDGTFRRSSIQRHENPDGSVTTEIRETNVDLGFLGVIIKAFRAILRALFGRAG
jgi:hypothetical protein